MLLAEHVTGINKSVIPIIDPSKQFFQQNCYIEYVKLDKVTEHDVADCVPLVYYIIFGDIIGFNK